MGNPCIPARLDTKHHTTFTFLQGRDAELCHVQRTEIVDFHGEMQYFRVGVFHPAVHIGTCIVDQVIDSAIVLQRGIHQPATLIELADVGGYGEDVISFGRQFIGCLLQLPVAPAVDDHFCAQFSQLECQRFPYPGAGPGNNHYFVPEKTHVVFFCRLSLFRISLTESKTAENPEQTRTVNQQYLLALSQSNSARMAFSTGV
jgi:hypothetical protein